MCCDDEKKMSGQTQIQGAVGQPVGFEVNPVDFMNPGGGFGEEDVMGAIFSQMGLSEGEEEMDPRMVQMRSSMGGM